MPEYINSIRAKKTASGIKLYGILDDIINELMGHENSSGYINLEVRALRQPLQTGQTHTVTIMEYQADCVTGKRAEMYRRPGVK